MNTTRRGFLVFASALLVTAAFAPLERVSRVLNVKDFGAVGDGEKDDTVALNAAMDAAQPGDTVFLPSGTYRIRPPLTIPGRVSLLGAT